MTTFSLPYIINTGRDSEQFEAILKVQVDTDPEDCDSRKIFVGEVAKLMSHQCLQDCTSQYLRIDLSPAYKVEDDSFGGGKISFKKFSNEFLKRVSLRRDPQFEESCW